MQALPGYSSEARWIRHARARLGYLFPYLPDQPGVQPAAARRRRADHRVDTAAGRRYQPVDRRCLDGRFHPGRMRPLLRHRPSQRHAGWAEYGYCASHSRDFWDPRLHLIATLGGLPIAFAITGAKADERQTLLGILDADPSTGTVVAKAGLEASQRPEPNNLRGQLY